MKESGTDWEKERREREEKESSILICLLSRVALVKSRLIYFGKHFLTHARLHGGMILRRKKIK
jgi:hypothetical protein